MRWRQDRQPIRHDLADVLRLRLRLDSKPHDAPVFATMPEKTALMIHADLRRARARWIRETRNPAERRERRASDFLKVADSAGRVVDFHALRVTFITMLVRSGVSVKAAQELARHSDPKLTMNTYTRLGVTDLAGALEALPSVPTGNPPEREASRATGTDDTPVQKDSLVKTCRLIPRQLAQNKAINHDTRRSKDINVTDLRIDENTNENAVFEGVKRDAPCRTRTYNLLIKSQLLCQLS